MYRAKRLDGDPHIRSMGGRRRNLSNRGHNMKRFLGVATVIGICVYALAASAGNLSTSADCPEKGKLCELGHSGSTSLAIVTDGGTVTFDGSITADSWVSAELQVVDVVSGALSPNKISVVSTAAEVTIADCSSSTIGDWYTIVVRDHDETIEVVSLDTSDVIYYSGITAVAGDELDSPDDAGSDTAGASVTLVCVAANRYVGIHTVGLWVDGGSAD
jgi:hypothetical protein